MQKITIECSSGLAASLTELASRCTQADTSNDGSTTRGPLDVESLLMLLAEDAGMVVTRPGSWEGANMSQVLCSHGYDI